jgi:rSAM/selenodomain-associated transferase 1
MIFCKAPVKGQVKTRLTPELSTEQAMRVHVELAQRTLQLATREALCPVELWCMPSTEDAFFTESAQAYPLKLRQQHGLDLGERMSHAFCAALKNYDCAVLIGCDCPSLTGQDLEAAITALNQKTSCVLGPAEDGGYVLIGLNQPRPELFDNMPWGTARVLEQTRARLKQYHLDHHELREQWDVDDPKDLARYYALNESSGDTI